MVWYESFSYNFIFRSMPRQRDRSSISRSRSNRRSKRHYRESSSSERDTRRKYRHQKPQRESPPKVTYSIKAKSDIKHHFRYDSIQIPNKKEAQYIMDKVRVVLEEQFGPVNDPTRLNKDEYSLSFGIGFKYDADALQFLKEGGCIKTQDGKKLIPKTTPIFQNSLAMIKEAKRDQKIRQKSLSPIKRYRSHSSSRPKKRKYSSISSDRRRSKQKSYPKKKIQERPVWIFGLPWSIKGKEVLDYFQRKHPEGPFYVNDWRWIKLKNSSCEFMEVLMDAKKAQKLLSMKDQLMIGDSPCIATYAQIQQTQEAVKHSLKQFQFRISFPLRVHPATLYRQLSQYAKVVQVISCSPLVEGRSESYTVTLGCAGKTRDLRRLYLKEQKIKIEDVRGQLVFRPTKSSKLTDNE